MKNSLKWTEYLVFSVIMFLAVGLNNIFPEYGMKNWDDVAYHSLFMSVVLIFVSGYKSELTQIRKWEMRLNKFIIYCLAMVIGGVVGLLVFK